MIIRVQNTGKPEICNHSYAKELHGEFHTLLMWDAKEGYSPINVEVP